MLRWPIVGRKVPGGGGTCLVKRQRLSGRRGAAGAWMLHSGHARWRSIVRLAVLRLATFRPLDCSQHVVCVSVVRRPLGHFSTGLVRRACST